MEGKISLYGEAVADVEAVVQMPTFQKMAPAPCVKKES